MVADGTLHPRLIHYRDVSFTEERRLTPDSLGRSGGH